MKRCTSIFVVVVVVVVVIFIPSVDLYTSLFTLEMVAQFI